MMKVLFYRTYKKNVSFNLVDFHNSVKFNVLIILKMVCFPTTKEKANADKYFQAI